MAGTIRTYAEILALIANNSTRAIGAVDLQDLAETWLPTHGEIWMEPGTAAETTFAAPSTFYPVTLGTVALGDCPWKFDNPSAGRLRSTAAAARACHVANSFSFTAAGNNKSFAFRIAQYDGDDVQVDDGASSEIRMTKATGTDIRSSALHWFRELDTNEYLVLEAANLTDTTSLTIVTFNLFAQGTPCPT